MKNALAFRVWIQDACEYLRYDSKTEGWVYRLKDRSILDIDAPIEVRITLYGKFGRNCIECEAYVPLSEVRQSEIWIVTWKQIKAGGVNGFINQLKQHSRMYLTTLQVGG